jgi:uncharacterized protein (DUF1697 family)
MLRGVNLGKRRMSMDALRAAYESLGLSDVRTYAQSGNVVFQTKERNLDGLSKRIEDAVEQKFGFHADNILRTGPELRDIIARNPFAKRRGIEPGKLLVVFLTGDPGPEAPKKILEVQCDPEELYLDGREMFIYFPNGMARPKLKMAHVDKVLKTRWTGRNWNTVLELNRLAGGEGSPSGLTRPAR